MARIALEKLILDGRIHPARIEEMVEKAQKEVEVMIREEGEAALLEVGVHGIHPELEVPHKLRSECVKAFNRSCSSFRTVGRRDGVRCPYGKACRIVT